MIRWPQTWVMARVIVFRLSFLGLIWQHRKWKWYQNNPVKSDGLSGSDIAEAAAATPLQEGCA